jgi:hypothetical protein
VCHAILTKNHIILEVCHAILQRITSH